MHNVCPERGDALCKVNAAELKGRTVGEGRDGERGVGAAIVKAVRVTDLNVVQRIASVREAQLEMGERKRSRDSSK